MMSWQAILVSKTTRWLASIIVLVGCLLFILVTASGLRLTLMTVPKLWGQHITIERVTGSFYRGFSLQNVRLENRHMLLYSKKIIWQWAKRTHAPYQLEVQLIDLGNIAYQSKDNVPARPPVKPPSLLHIPFHWRIDEIRFAGIKNLKEQGTLSHGGMFALDYYNERYTLTLHYLDLMSYLYRGTVVLSAKAPLDLRGKIGVCDVRFPAQCYGSVQISHSFVQPNIDIYIKHKKMLVKGNMWFAPYAPINTQKLLRVNIHAQHVNPHQFMVGWPKADLSFDGNLQATNIYHTNELAGVFRLINATPAYYEAHGLPLSQLEIRFLINENGSFQLINGELKTIKNGYMKAKGEIDPDGALHLIADMHLGFIHLMNTPIDNVYEGIGVLTGTYRNPVLELSVNSKWHSLQLKAILATKIKLLKIKKVVVYRHGKGFEGSGIFHLQDRYALDLALRGHNFDPQLLSPSYPQATINGTINVKGNLYENTRIDMDIDHSNISGHPFYAKGFIDFSPKKLNSANLRFHVGDNILLLRGQLKDQHDRLLIQMRMLNLQQLGFGFSGSAMTEGYIQGTLVHPLVKLKGEFHQVRVPKTLSLDNLNFNLTLARSLDSPLKVSIQGHGLHWKNFLVNRIDTMINGTLASHNGYIQIHGKNIYGKQMVLFAQAQGRFDQQRQWRGQLQKLVFSGPLALQLQSKVSIFASKDLVHVGESRWRFIGGQIYLDHLAWRKKQGISTKGNASGLHLAVLRQLTHSESLPFEDNVILQGDWDFSYKDNASGYIHFTRKAGDLFFSTRKTALGLNQFDWNTQLLGKNIYSQLIIKTRFINALLNLVVAQHWGRNLSTLPLKGQLQFRANSIENFKYLLPVDKDIQGQVYGNASIGGTVAAPTFRGQIIGDNIQYRDYDYALYLRNGTLRSRLQDQRWIIDELRFHDKKGSILISGSLGRLDKNDHANLDVNFDHYLLINQPDRQFVISGRSKLFFESNTPTLLQGDLILDRGFYQNLKDTMPQLSNDVHIIGEQQQFTQENKKVIPLLADLNLNLNRALVLTLHDINLRLGGQVQVKTSVKQGVRLNGKVIAIEGQYRAYGQNLRVEQGSLVFDGTSSIMDAPLHLVAKRYQSPVGAGIDVTGSLREPHVRLIADSVISDREKLSWLVLGRESKGEDDERALTLTMALWAAQKFNKKTGLILDNIALSSNEKYDAATGEKSTSQPVVTLGKQLSRHLYMGYEVGVQGGSQAIRLIYSISQALSVFTRLGKNSGQVGLKYHHRFD